MVHRWARSCSSQEDDSGRTVRTGQMDGAAGKLQRRQVWGMSKLWWIGDGGEEYILKKPV